jgi:23S rRNA (cytidine1920-2'-O)/16S rRNA (cytidine1409-2'-O)-methyltransferase
VGEEVSRGKKQTREPSKLHPTPTPPRGEVMTKGRDKPAHSAFKAPPSTPRNPSPPPKPRRVRADIALVEVGLAPTREKAQALIMAGAVYIGEVRVDKSSHAVLPDAPLAVRGKACPFVSRGGLKLDAALDAFEIPVDGKTCADLGSSTGGFTHCLLLRGARKVYAVDVGKGLLDASLRKDPRVELMEGVNARYLQGNEFPVGPDLVTVDASFISLRLLLPAIQRAAPRAPVVALVKPQFEVGKGRVGKGGIVRDEVERDRAVGEVSQAAEALGYAVVGRIQSPVTGAKGNVEYLLHLVPGNKLG